MSYGWPDVIIVVAAAIMVHKGWKRGFVVELGGIIALVAAIAAAFFYPGVWDDFLEHFTRLGIDSAHVVGMALFALLAYTIMASLGWTLSRFGKHKFVDPINAFLGSVLGLVKAGILFWLIVYTALFFPLSSDLRSDMRRSFIIPILTSHNAEIDRRVREGMPWFVRPFSSPVFKRHRL